MDEHIADDTKDMKSVTRSFLCILQWNVDGIKSKSNQLASRLQAFDIDIAVVQKSWLSSSDRTLVIKNYCAVREDLRVNIKRGGLFFYIERSILLDNAGYITKKGHQISTIRARLGRKKWLFVTSFT